MVRDSAAGWTFSSPDSWRIDVERGDTKGGRRSRGEERRVAGLAKVRVVVRGPFSDVLVEVLEDMMASKGRDFIGYEELVALARIFENGGVKIGEKGPKRNADGSLDTGKRR